MQHAVLHCRDAKRHLVGLSILAAFRYGYFQFIKLIVVFDRIDGFTLRKKLIVDCTLSVPLNEIGKSLDRSST